MPKVIKGAEAPRQTLKPGDCLFREGQASDSFFIIKSGKVEIFKNFGKPGQILLATIGEGRVLGEVSAIDTGPRSATAVAKTEVEVTCVGSQVLLYQLKQNPTWFQAVVLDLVERLRSTGNLLVQKGIQDPQAHSSQKQTDPTS